MKSVSYDLTEQYLDLKINNNVIYLKTFMFFSGTVLFIRIKAASDL